MDRQSWRSPVRWGLIAVFVVIGLVAAIMGIWWTAVTMACFVAAQLASVAYERRKAAKRHHQAEP